MTKDGLLWGGRDILSLTVVLRCPQYRVYVYGDTFMFINNTHLYNTHLLQASYLCLYAWGIFLYHLAGFAVQLFLLSKSAKYLNWASLL